MSILTERKTWKRKRAPERQAAIDLRRLTPSQQRNVRRVLAHLTLELGGRHKMAAALGVSINALKKYRAAHRVLSARTLIAVARVAQVGIDDVLAGRWKRHACEECGCVGVV